MSENRKKVLLIGNPNVGKSAIFSRITGAKVIISNYPGCTVEFTQGEMQIDDEHLTVIDIPGTYSLEPTCKAEEVAVEMLNNGDIIINVVDATNLERNLFLTLQLLEKKLPVIIALNMWDDTRHRGIHIDIKKLEECLGVPVVATSGLSGEGIWELTRRMGEASGKHCTNRSFVNKWESIGDIISQSQKLTHRHHTFLDRLEDLSIKPLTGFLIAGLVVFFSFGFVRLISEMMINYIFDPLFNNLWTRLMMSLSLSLGDHPFISHILFGDLINGVINNEGSFGLLTTGMYIPIVMVFPYILSFYFILGLMEDFGYLPRLAVLSDNFMHRIGLHGYAIIPFILGMGCNVPGGLAIRVLEERREKFIAATLMAIAVPCMAQTAMIVGLVGQRGIKHLVTVFLTLITIFIVKGILLNMFMKGSSPEILLEIPPYRKPQLGAVIKKLMMRMKAFIAEALPLVFLGILVINILYSLKIVDVFIYLLSPVINKLWGLSDTIVPAMIIGFLRKDVAVGMLGTLNLTDKQLVISATMLAVYFPCFATYVVLWRELGISDLIKSTILMILTATIVGAVLNYIL